MQSILDVSLLAVLGGAVLLLLLILISYLIVSRRISSLEKENHKLKERLDSTLKALSEQALKNTQSIEVLERKLKASSQSLQYLTDNQQDIFNRQKVLNTSFDDLSLRMEQQKKQFENNSIENQPIIMAKRLLSEGMSVSEVALKTSLPSNEVEMLSKVHRIVKSAPAADDTRKDENESQPAVRPAVSDAQPGPAARTAVTGHQVASMKARDAYGISSKSNLRRPR